MLRQVVAEQIHRELLALVVAEFRQQDAPVLEIIVVVELPAEEAG